MANPHPAGAAGAAATTAALPPVPTAVSLAGNGQTYSITPLRLGELPRMAAAAAPIAGRLSSISGSADWVALLGVHGDAMLQMLAIATRRPLADIEALSLDDAVTLTDAVLAVNADFFVRQVLPNINAASQRLGALGSMTWPTPSPT